ncbi:hypothetical protein VW23_012405 [Devosia insulae DS-56]|uniref:Uncharacterized protein n=1 Tax=Devosia insulae DS-56 TaxID=1116389 RepID=A0A1E5XUH2_9HYPH|nr:hypothetical protein VW23_012405 [Devosia insulae DS-56]
MGQKRTNCSTATAGQLPDELCSDHATGAFFDEATSTFWQYFNQYVTWRRSDYASWISRTM